MRRSTVEGRPAPEPAQVFVSFARFTDIAQYERYLAALERDAHWREVVRPGLRQYLSAEPIVWRLVPVARSRPLERPWELEW